MVSFLAVHMVAHVLIDKFGPLLAWHKALKLPVSLPADTIFKHHVVSYISQHG